MDAISVYRAFGQAIQRHRKRLGLTQDDIARRVGLSRTSITNIEKGRQKVLLHQILEFAACLEVAPEALLPAQPSLSKPLDIDRKLGRAKDLVDEEKKWVERVIQPPVAK